MNIIFSVNDKTLETTPDVDKAFVLHKLCEIVIFELMNTNEKEIAVKATMGEHKTRVFLEKSPRSVENGIVTLKNYMHDRLSNLILSMYRRRELEYKSELIDLEEENRKTQERIKESLEIKIEVVKKETPSK